jgi:aminoglycoside phosphotransferase family enzyme
LRSRTKIVVGETGVVAFLHRREAYREATTTVTAIETHMSWVFLTDAYAYKLKKPIRTGGLDLSTPQRRRANCDEEVRLNRRLAPEVYLGVLALTRHADGTLALDGTGEPIDWLVRMRRLPAAKMLDLVITGAGASAAEGEVRATARHVAHFYRTAPPEAISGPGYRAALAEGTRQDARELTQARYGLPRGRVEVLANAQLAMLAAHPSLFDRRADAGRIVEGHGDLRPEHIFVGSPPAVIDCLEFDRSLRLLDPSDELSFLSLECERLGDARVGEWFLDAYREATGDAPPPSLLHFYRVYRALRRSTIAARHLDDPTVHDPDRFAARARLYLTMVEPVR